MNSTLFKLPVLLLTLFNLQLILADELIIKVSQGRLKGYLELTRKSKTFAAFTGIPYAKPPVGELRFKEPVAIEPWQDVLDATKNHNICPQVTPNGVQGNEDCLFLNVYTSSPRNVTNLPVIFYIHGGGFSQGAADKAWYGPDYLLDENIILVTMNYRLGPLGFLSTGDDEVPGNNALKDLSLALRWVKENIASFGGNANKISIIGHSAGAGISHLFTFSPLTRGLISSVVAQSGGAFNCWSIQPISEAVSNTKILAELVGCFNTDNKTMVKCLREVKVEDIIETFNHFLSLSKGLAFRPVIEPHSQGAFLSESPKTIISSGNAANVPFLTGITTDDGAVISEPFLGDARKFQYLNENFKKVLPFTLYYEHNERKDEITDNLRKHYYNNKSVNIEARKELTDLFTESMFGIGADLAVRLHKQYIQQPSYYYLFGYRGTESHSKLFGDAVNDYGVVHADELLYLFNLTTMFPSYVPGREDNEMIDLLVKMWTNFASTGNPTPQYSNLVKWNPVSSAKNEYYFIKNPAEQQMEENLLIDQFTYLRSLNMYSDAERRDEL